MYKNSMIGAEKRQAATCRLLIDRWRCAGTPARFTRCCLKSNLCKGKVMPASRISIITCLTLVVSSAAFLSSTPAYASGVLAPDPPSPNWHVVSSPDTSSTQNNYVLAGGHTCLSRTDCWMVGYYNNGTVNQTLIENYNGRSWIITPSPNQATTGGASLDNQLNGVTCTAVDNCWATGHYVNGTNQTLALHWDGTSWSIVSTPNLTKGSMLLGVQCLSASQCYAVGHGTASSGPPQALIEAYDGASWTVVAWPNTLSNSNTAPNELLSLSCANSTHCWTAGWQTLNGVHQTAVVMFDGTVWSAASPPNQTTNTDNVLSSIFCTSRKSCLAVGYYNTAAANYQTLSESYDGISWTITPSANQNITYNNQLIQVSCPSARLCWATLVYSDGTATRSLFEQYTGTSWSIYSTPEGLPSGGENVTLLACVSTRLCWAGGSYLTGGYDQTIILQYNAPPLGRHHRRTQPVWGGAVAPA